jgi:hypothetical protein
MSLVQLVEHIRISHRPELQVSRQTLVLIVYSIANDVYLHTFFKLGISANLLYQTVKFIDKLNMSDRTTQLFKQASVSLCVN